MCRNSGQKVADPDRPQCLINSEIYYKCINILEGTKVCALSRVLFPTVGIMSFIGIPYFTGQIHWADAGEAIVPDYEVVHIRDSQVGRAPQTGTLNGELEHVITLNGIDYVWIYRIPR